MRSSFTPQQVRPIINLPVGQPTFTINPPSIIQPARIVQPPVIQPSSTFQRPTNQLSIQPSVRPTIQPSIQPTTQPIIQLGSTMQPQGSISTVVQPSKFEELVTPLPVVRPSKIEEPASPLPTTGSKLILPGQLQEFNQQIQQRMDNWMNNFFPPSFWSQFQPPRVIKPGDQLALPQDGERIQFSIDPPLTINLSKSYNWSGQLRQQIHVYKVEVTRERPFLFFNPAGQGSLMVKVYHDGGSLEVEPELAKRVQETLESRYRTKLTAHLQWSGQGAEQQQIAQGSPTTGTNLQTMSEQYVILRVV